MTFDPPSFVRRLQHRERALVAARPYDKSLPRALERPDLGRPERPGNDPATERGP